MQPDLIKYHQRQGKHTRKMAVSSTDLARF